MTNIADNATNATPPSPYARVADKLVDQGFSVIPIEPGTKRPGHKRQGEWRPMGKWQQFCTRLPTWREIAQWSKMPDAGIGVAMWSRKLNCVDVDDDDALSIVIAALPPTPVIKKGKKGGTLFFRGELKSAALNKANGQRLLDILGEGRQTVIPPSIHPTGVEYKWLGAPLEQFTPEQLPEITEADIDRMREALASFGPVDAAIPANDDKAAPSGPHGSFGSDGDSPFRKLNDLALANLDMWVPALGLPRWERKARGYCAVADWRKSTTGRPLDKRKLNLSITTAGIKDFGDGPKGYTPIDLVIKARGVDFDAAFSWLAECVGFGAQTFDFGAWTDFDSEDGDEDAPDGSDAPMGDGGRRGAPLDDESDESGWVGEGAYHRKPKGGVVRDDFYSYAPQNRYIYAPVGDMWPAASVNARIPPIPLVKKNGKPLLDEEGKQKKAKATAWLDRNRSVEQATWAPGYPQVIRDKLISDGGWIEKKGVAIFNLYRPPTIIHGDATQADMWLDHVIKVYPDEADHIFDWLAHRVQRPHEKINHALVLGGAPGVGKDTLLEPLKHGVGHWNFQEVSPVAMMGRFNGFLKSVVLRMNESRDLGDVDRYALYDHMKTYIAAPPDVLRIDEKNIREHSIFNVTGVIITTNYRTGGLYLPADDRRHFVAWSNAKKEEFSAEYWQLFWRWYAEGGLQNVVAWLAQRDLSKFDPKAPPPKTAAFWAIVDAGRPSETSAVADAIEKLHNPPALTIDDVVGEIDDLPLRAWMQDRKNSRLVPHRFEECGYVAIRNDANESGYWNVKGNRKMIYAKATLTLQEQFAAARNRAARGY